MRILFISLLSFFIITGCNKVDPLNYDAEQGAPHKTIEERDLWGKEHLGITYYQAIKWVKEAKIIKQKVGNIISIAPVGKPNYVRSYITDGLQGYITLEIIGDERTAIFSAYSLAPCSTKGICFRKGILQLNEQEIPLHHSGVSMANFNQPSNKINYLTNQIESYNQQFSQYNNSPIFNSITYKLWYERATAYADDKNYVNASLDMEKAITLLSESKIPSPFKDEELEKYFFQLAYYYYHQGKFNQSSEAITNAIEQIKSNKYQVYPDEHILWLWITRMREGKKELANEELRQAIKQAKASQKSCGINIATARLYLGEIEESEFIQSIEKDPLKYTRFCKFSNVRGISYAYYYAGQKEIADGNFKKGAVLLQKFIQHQAASGLKLKLAMSELERINKSTNH